MSILLTDVVLASPVRSRAIAEAERLEYAIEEGKIHAWTSYYLEAAVVKYNIYIYIYIYILWGDGCGVVNYDFCEVVAVA